MKRSNSQLALVAVILAVAFPVAGRADDDEAPAHQGSSLQAKAEYCSDCHGASGRGYRGYLTMPRLAGQTPEYLENQLRAFADRSRGRSLPMNMGKVHGLSPGMRTALARHFMRLNPRPFGGAPRHLSATGKKIYEEGVPQSNIPACAACHGLDGRGAGANPRLAGQLYPYTVRGLTNWRRDRASETSAVMLPIAQSLSKSQIAAIAAYLNQLK